jgi:hypothetical protein
MSDTDHFVAREAELARLGAMLDLAMGGKGQVLRALTEVDLQEKLLRCDHALVAPLPVKCFFGAITRSSPLAQTIVDNGLQLGTDFKLGQRCSLRQCL